MPQPTWIIEPDYWDSTPIIADLAAIRQYNPQRLEMEQLTAIVCEDPARHVCVGYKDLTPDEFWVRGYASQLPIMPPLLMCEAAAQLANYYARKHNLYTVQGGFVGLKGVRWREIVGPGQRLFIMAKLLKIRATLMTCQFQCAVRRRLVCEGILIGGIFMWMKDQRCEATAATVSRLDGV